MAFTKIPLILVLCLLGLLSGSCTSGGTSSGGGSVSDIISDDFFNGIINLTDNGCDGKNFYTRNSFIDAANTFPKFGNSVTKREIATMFAHFTQQTGHFCNIEEINDKLVKEEICEENPVQEPCTPSPPRRRRRRGRGGPPRKYFGRGPMQLSGNYNYGACGQSLNLDLLRKPELVSSNPTVAFRTGLWLWMNKVRPVLNQGFGATIRAINSKECNGGNSDAVNARIKYYKDYCGQLSVDPGPNLSC